MFKTSRNIIVIGICLPMILLDLTTTNVFIGNLTFAMCASAVLMTFFGFFGREERKLAEDGPPSTEEEYYARRAQDFQQRYEEGKNLVEQDRFVEQVKELGDKYLDMDDPNAAIITMIDDEGNASAIIIKDDGEIIIDGTPNPEVLEAAKQLQESIKLHGPEAIAEEIRRQINRGE
jgi:hypothetical protein